MSFIIRTREANTRLLRLAVAAVRSAFGPPWGRPVTHTTMPCAKASSRRSSASFSLAGNSCPKLKQRSPASATSRASTIRSVCLQPLDTNRLSIMSSRLLKNLPRPRRPQANQPSTKAGQSQCQAVYRTIVRSSHFKIMLSAILAGACYPRLVVQWAQYLPVLPAGCMSERLRRACDGANQKAGARAPAE